MRDSVDNIPVKIAFIGGGSLNWAVGLMADLAYDLELVAEVRLYDIDLEAARRNVALGARFNEVSRGAPARYSACDNLHEALSGADVVVISILPGRFEDMAEDIAIPARYGIPQAVGDTVGPGGYIRALRAIPMFVEIAEAIRDHAPQAFVCNLTNPMSLLTSALYATFPGIRAWGECHEVTKIRRQVAALAGGNRSFRDVDVNVLGINHFTFVDRISLDGQDMMPVYRAFVAAQGPDGFAQTEPGKSAEHASYFGSRCRVAFDLMQRFGIPAAAGDRHLAEFLPVSDYLADPDQWGFALTPVAFRIKDRAAKRARVADMVDGRIAPQAARSDEAMIEQIKALMTGRPFVSNANLPNRGQLSGLPDGAIVETNAVFSGLGIQPVVAGRLPAPLEEITRAHATRQQSFLLAARTGDLGTLFSCFRDDPLVTSVSDGEARSMWDEMLAATAHLLPDSLKGAA